jgi:hypothetical protein
LPFSQEIKDILYGLHLIEFDQIKEQLNSRSVFNTHTAASDRGQGTIWAQDLLKHILGINIIIGLSSKQLQMNSFYAFPSLVFVYQDNKGNFTPIHYSGSDTSVIQSDTWKNWIQ